MKTMVKSMSDELPDDIHDAFEELAQGFHAITILYNEENSFPEVDLGDVPPQVAITVMQQVINALHECLPGPVIKYNGNVVYSERFMYEDDDE